MKSPERAAGATHGVTVCAEKIAFLASVIKHGAMNDWSDDAVMRAAVELMTEMTHLGSCAVVLMSAVTDVDVNMAVIDMVNRKTANDPPGS